MWRLWGEDVTKKIRQCENPLWKFVRVILQMMLERVDFILRDNHHIQNRHAKSSRSVDLTGCLADMLRLSVWSDVLPITLPHRRSGNNTSHHLNQAMASQRCI